MNTEWRAGDEMRWWHTAPVDVAVYTFSIMTQRDRLLFWNIFGRSLYPDSLGLSSSNTRSAAAVAGYCGLGSVAVDGPEMAEYSQTGILTALLLFTVVTLRDIYVGRNSMTQQDSAGPDILTQRPNKHTFYTGPVLKFQFWWETSQTFMLYSVFTVCLKLFKGMLS